MWDRVSVHAMPWMSMLLATALLASGCGTGSVPVASLARNPQTYQGKEVETSGVVRGFTDRSGRYFVIEDTEQHRVAVLPASRLAKYEGRRIEVSGRFDVDETTGRFIRVEHVSIRRG